MKKIYIGIGVAIVLLAGTFGIFKWRSNSLDKTKSRAHNYDKYEMTCHMEMLENDELKSYLVNVSYLLKDKKEFYKVELYDKSLNQSQVIVKNEEGVFVLTPTLNQIFKFQSDWPNNSPKPYIYKSLLSMLDSGHVEKTKDGYIARGEVKYPNDNRVTSQEVVFTKSLVPQRVVVYDKEETEIIKLDISEFNHSPSLDINHFNQQKVLEDTAKQERATAGGKTPLYPVAALGSRLESETVTKINDTDNHVLKFSGTHNFTIVESMLHKNDVMKEDVMDGESIDFVDGIAFYKDNELTMMQSGVLCKVYSKDLNKKDMIQVVSSLQAQNSK